MAAGRAAPTAGPCIAATPAIRYSPTAVSWTATPKAATAARAAMAQTAPTAAGAATGRIPRRPWRPVPARPEPIARHGMRARRRIGLEWDGWEWDGSSIYDDGQLALARPVPRVLEVQRLRRRRVLRIREFAEVPGLHVRGQPRLRRHQRHRRRHASSRLLSGRRNGR